MEAVKNVKKNLKLDDLKKALIYDTNTGLFIWSAPKKKVVVGAVAGSLQPTGYIAIKLNGVAYLAHRLAWFYVHGKWPLDQIDHINGVRDDNRLSNLRESTRSQNHQNKIAPCTNTSGAKGVSWSKKDGAWRARVKLEGKEHFLGNFSTVEAASAAAIQGRERLHTGFSNHGISKRASQ